VVSEYLPLRRLNLQQRRYGGNHSHEASRGTLAIPIHKD
jgi:hypothetical protein